MAPRKTGRNASFLGLTYFVFSGVHEKGWGGGGVICVKMRLNPFDLMGLQQAVGAISYDFDADFLLNSFPIRWAKVGVIILAMRGSPGRVFDLHNSIVRLGGIITCKSAVEIFGMA